MCLAVPSRIINIADLMATVDVYGARRDISLLLLPEEAKVGEYVLVHAGFAIQKLEEEVAMDTLRILKEISDIMEAEEGNDTTGNQLGGMNTSL